MDGNKKPFMRRCWWPFSILIILLVFFILFAGEAGCGLHPPNERIVGTFTPDSHDAFMYNSPTIVGGFIYIGTSTRITMDESPAMVIAALPASFFYKLDLNLKVVWQCALASSQVGGGASLDSKGNIYFTTFDYTADTLGLENKGYLTLISLCSLTPEGQLRWKKQISAPNEGWIHAMLNCAVGTDDTIYVGDSKLFAFNPDGTVKWQYPRDNRVIYGMRSSPIIDGTGNIYFVSPEPVNGETDVISAYKFIPAGTDVISAYKFSPDGTVVWSTVLDNNILDPEGGQTMGGGSKDTFSLSTPAFSLGQKYLYAAVGNTINKVDTASGQIIWSVKPQGATGAFKASPAVDNQDNIYIGTKSNIESTLYAIKANGSLIWKRVIGADLYSSPLLGDDGKIYFGSEGTPDNRTHFHAVDSANGTPVWDTGSGKSPMPDLSFGSPALYGGYIYIGCYQINAVDHSEALYKIKADAQGYLPGAAWPRFHGGNDNSGRGP